MALRWIEGFETFGGSGTSLTSGNAHSQLLAKYNSPVLSGDTIATGYSGGLAWNSPGGSSAIIVTPTFTSQQTWVVGRNLYTTALGSGFNYLGCRDGTTNQVTISVSSSGAIVAKSGPTTLGTSSSGAIATSAWNYVEVLITISSTLGVVTVKVNGTTVLNLTGQNTQASSNASCNNFQLYGSLSLTASTLHDDIYILDSTGSNNNTFLGPQIVEAIVPTGAGASTQWTPSTGSNYACVDDTPEDGDTTYVSDSTSGDLDEYAFGNLSRIISNVRGVQINTLGKYVSSAGSVIPVVRSGGADYVQTTVPLTTAYLNNAQVVEQDPGTSAPWTVSGVNAAQFGVKVA